MTLVDDVITTPRLKLVLLTPPLLRAVAGGNLAEVERQLGASVAAGWEEGVPAELRLEQLAADPSEQPWLVRAVLATAPRRGVGSVGSPHPAGPRRACRDRLRHRGRGAPPGLRPRGDPRAARLGVGDRPRPHLRRL